MENLTFDFLMRVEPIRLAEIVLNESFSPAARLSASEALAARAAEIDSKLPGMAADTQAAILAAMALDLSAFNFAA